MHILDIPTEISGKIFRYLLPQSLFQCAFVCKSWNVPVLQLWYDKLWFNGYQVYRTNQKLKLDVNARDVYFKYAPFVKELMLMQDDKNFIKYHSRECSKADSLQETDCKFDEDDFILLLEYLPNIQNLFISCSAHANKYLQYILDTESNKCLNQIQVITPISSFSQCYDLSHTDNMYFLICYKYRATVNSLELNYKQVMMELGPQYDKTLTFLSHFTRLTNLTLENTCDNSLTTFDIQKACPHLTALKYKSKNGIPDEIVKNILNDPANRNLNSNLKSLELSIPTVPVNYARYITDYVSPQADTLHLIIDAVNLYDWIDDIGMDNALKLANRLSTVKTAGFNCITDEDYKKKSTNYESKMTIFFKLLNAFKGDKNTFCRADYSDFSYRLCNSMNYSLKDGLSLSYGLEYADYYFPDEVHVGQGDYIDQEHRSPRMVEIVLPDIARSMIGPEVINYLNIRMYDNNPELAFKFLEYALIHCPKLECFDFMSQNGNPHQGIRIATDIDQYKKRENHHIKSTQENLRVIKTEDFIPPKEFLNLISTYLPNIEFFACNDPGSATTTPKTTEIDFTAFENLKTFYFDIKVLSGYHTNHAFIHLMYSDGDEAYYCQNYENPLALNPTTLEFLQECNNDKKFVTLSITIKCNKDVKFVVCWYHYAIIAEFDNGNLLDHISIDSNFFRKSFYM